jgi:hypothetical protein
MGFSSERSWVAVIICTAGVLGSLSAAAADEFTPHPHQFDLTIDNLSSFVAGTSLVRVRENKVSGIRLHLAQDLSIDTMQLPSLELTYWFDELNALQLHLRYFEAGGSHGLPRSANFNGATLAPGQRLKTGDTIWFEGALYYERRLTPLLQKHLGGFALVHGLDLRAKIGLEYTYLDFRLNNGRARVTPTSKGEESKEDFYHQELPMPTLGLEVRRRLTEHVALEGTLKGNWINHWNSLRDEGGTVYTSQWGFETHWRLFYINPAWLGALQPFVGIGYFFYRQNEQSREDGNFIRLSTFGPEVGVSYSF